MDETTISEFVTESKILRQKSLEAGERFYIFNELSIQT